MNIKKLWENFKFPRCEFCKKNCQGHLDYNNLCANVNYLREYGEKNYEKNIESFISLKNVINANISVLNIFSFGCGLGFDFLGAKETFGPNINYFGIDESDWAIKHTDAYKNLDFELPEIKKYDEGMFLLNVVKESPVICFFNSLFTISNNSNLLYDLIGALNNKTTFYLICDYTINNNYHMPKAEQEIILKLQNELINIFSFKHFEILGGRGIIVVGERR